MLSKKSTSRVHLRLSYASSIPPDPSQPLIQAAAVIFYFYYSLAPPMALNILRQRASSAPLCRTLRSSAFPSARLTRTLTSPSSTLSSPLMPSTPILNSQHLITPFSSLIHCQTLLVDSSLPTRGYATGALFSPHSLLSKYITEKPFALTAVRESSTRKKVSLAIQPLAPTPPQWQKEGPSPVAAAA